MAKKSIEAPRQEKTVALMRDLMARLEKDWQAEEEKLAITLSLKDGEIQRPVKPAAANEGVPREEETAGSIVNGVLLKLYQARAMADIIVCSDEGQLDGCGLRHDTVGALKYALSDIIEESINALDCRTISALPMRQGDAA